jgi:hypothetical protein
MASVHCNQLVSTLPLLHLTRLGLLDAYDLVAVQQTQRVESKLHL